MNIQSFLLASATALGLVACAGQSLAPSPTTATAAAQNAAVPIAPQCWNGDAGKFVAVGVTETISNVVVVCEKTSDGKNAQWMGKKP